MTKERKGGESAICSSPSSIIKQQLSKHEAEIRCYKERRPEGVCYLAALKAEEYPDVLSIRGAQERLDIWDRVIRWFELLCWFAGKLEEAEYSGERHSFIQLARAFSRSDVSIREWRNAFFYFGIETHQKVWFPVKGERDICEIEAALRALAQGDWLLATELERVVKASPKTAVYKEVKRELEQRGWKWGQKRIGGKLTKIIVAPSETVDVKD
jgi:hypothetical protein